MRREQARLRVVVITCCMLVYCEDDIITAVYERARKARYFSFYITPWLAACQSAVIRNKVIGVIYGY